MRFLRNWLAKGVLAVSEDFEERLAACEQQLGTLTTQARRTRMKALRNDPLVDEAVERLAQMSPDPGPVPVNPAPSDVPKFVSVARKARGT